MAINLRSTNSMSSLKNVTEKGVEQANSKTTKDIPLTLLDCHPLNSQIYTINDIESLMASIERNGFLGAINVYAKPDGRYLIYIGHRRFEAMKRLGKKTIPCIVEKMESEDVILRKLIEGNLNVRVVSPMERANEIVAYEKVLLDNGFTGSIQKELSAVFNMSARKIIKIKNIYKFSSSLKKYAYDLSFPYEAFDDAVYFTEKQQNKLAELIEQHFNNYPDAELSKLIVLQFIDKIKTEDKLEKERLEREKKLKEEEQLKAEMYKTLKKEIEDERKQKEIETEEIIEVKSSVEKEPLHMESQTSPIPEEIETSILTSEEEFTYTSTEEFSNEIDYQHANISTEEFSDRAEEVINIDFDILQYSKRLKTIVEQDNTSASSDVKEQVKLILQEVINLL